MTPDMVKIIFSPAIVYRFAGAKMVKRRDTLDCSKGFIVGRMNISLYWDALWTTMKLSSIRLVEGNFIQGLIYDVL